MTNTLPAMQETWVQSLGQEDPLEKVMATHFSILAWRIPWTEELGGLQSPGSQSRTWLKRLSTVIQASLRLNSSMVLQKPVQQEFSLPVSQPPQSMKFLRFACVLPNWKCYLAFYLHFPRMKPVLKMPHTIEWEGFGTTHAQLGRMEGSASPHLSFLLKYYATSWLIPDQ